MEIKTAAEMRIEFWGSNDGRSYDRDEEELMKLYAHQAVRLALEEAAKQIGQKYLKVGDQYYPASMDKIILSLADSIIGKLK